MELLLKITSQPAEYRLKVENARLEAREQTRLLGFDLERRPTRLRLKSRDTQVQLDSTRLRESMGLKGSAAWASAYAARGAGAAYQAAGQAVQDGNDMARIDEGVTIGQIVRERMLRQPQTFTVFLPSAGVDISWEPGELLTEWDPGDLQFDWELLRQMMDYIPGKVSIDIIKPAEVLIEYVGEPNYVPPSARPGGEDDVSGE